MADESRFSYQRLEKPNKFLKGSFTVMFIDIVRFTKYGDNEALRNAVRALQSAIMDVCEDLEWDVGGPATPNDAVMMPTGDGYGIGFESSRVDERAILNYAVQLSNRLKAENVSVRIGINHGPCYVHKDVNNKMNLAGWGIVDAERVMSCGDKDHILCTGAFARPLIDAKDEPNLHNVGDYVKKGRRLEVYNYYSDEFGNSDAPIKPANNNKDKAGT
jgi:class 3 adenylate cyclase